MMSGTNSYPAGRFNICVDIWKPSDTSAWKFAAWNGVTLNYGGEHKNISGGSHLSNTGAVTGIKFAFANGNISGTFRLYGITNG